RQPDLVQCLAQRQLDVSRRQSRRFEDEEADERARLASQWKRQGDPFAPELGPARRDRVRARLRLTYQPTRHGRFGRPFAPLAVDPAAETVLVPRDQRAPRNRPSLTDPVQELTED